MKTTHIFSGIVLYMTLEKQNKYTLENTEGPIKKMENPAKLPTYKTKTQHNMRWTPQCANKHK